MLATRNSNDCVIFISNNGTQSEMQSIAKVIADYHIPIATISSTSDNQYEFHALVEYLDRCEIIFDINLLLQQMRHHSRK
jgi:DNA-binding MurR/RpiR family transcriptional regulator